MIPPVDKYSQEELEEEKAYKERPQWLKFYYGAWLISTGYMDAEQEGWYIHLLSHSASEGEIPGYLPDDDVELKEKAGFQSLSLETLDMIKDGISFPEGYIQKVILKREARWQKIRGKFATSSKYPGYIYNRRLTKILDSAYKNRDQNVEAGKISAEKRSGKFAQPKKIATDVEMDTKLETLETKLPKQKELSTDVGTASPTAVSTSLSLPLSLVNNIQVNSEVQSNEQELVLEVQEKNKTVEKKLTGRKSKRRVSETLFEEDKFVVTEHMKGYLIEKYHNPNPEVSIQFSEGDINYLAEKFKLRFYGTWYTSWARTFYNFVENQFAKYNYRVGQFNWRASRGENNEKTDRRARDQREKDDYLAELRSRGSGDNRADPPGLSLDLDGN